MTRKLPMKKKKGISALLKTRVVLIIALIIFGFVSFAIVEEVIRRHAITDEVDDLKGEIELLEGRNDELSSLISYLKSTDYQEQEARIKLGLKKPGETVLNIPESVTDNANSSKGAENNSTAVLIEQPNPQKWWNFIFSN
ncbi:MAG: septum formation initiator family protein [bacterium]